MSDPTGPALPEAGVNPALSDCGQFVATAKLAFVDGRLRQLFVPMDGEKNAAEWREVESFDTTIEPPVWP